MNESDETTRVEPSSAGWERDEASASAEPAESEVPSTGHPEIDAVLRSLEDLDARPLEEQVRTFEAAHEHLRAALSAAGDDSGAQPGPAPAG